MDELIPLLEVRELVIDAGATGTDGDVAAGPTPVTPAVPVELPQCGRA